jgi:hypothetical protein
VYERGASPFWATETIGTATWAGTLNVTSPSNATTHRALIYGFHPETFNTKDPQISKFEHFTIPAIPNDEHTGALALTAPGVNIGLCAMAAVNSTQRVQHVNEVLPKKELRCSTPPEFGSLSTSSVFAGIPAILGRAFDMFAPQPLHAAVLLGAVGGSKGELSPSAVIDMEQVTLSFVFPILDGKNTTPLLGSDSLPVKVLVATKGGTPLAGVHVKHELAGNSSVIAFFSESANCGPPTAASVTRGPTGADGIASFAGVCLTKAGGYQLVATGTFDGVPAQPKLSNSFNIQNK